MPQDRTPFYASSETAQTPQRGIRISGKLILVLIITAASLLAAVGGGAFCFLYRMAETLPTLSELESIEPPLVTKVMAADSTVIHEFSTERRFWVPLSRIPDDLTDAVVAIEDRRFYKHWGIDIRRIVGAVLVDLIHREFAQGASTITQQLARNLYLTARQSLIRKVREALTAVQVESHYTKREILELYLNQVYLGAGTYGVEAASQRYFSKSVSDLDLNECATLAGTIQLPERYRPDLDKNLERAASRRNTVLRVMAAMEFIDRRAAKAIAARPVPSNPKKAVVKAAPYLIDMVRRHVSQKFGDKLLYEGGLTIHTTLNPAGQDSADISSKRHLASLQRRLNRMCVDSSRIYRSVGLRRDTFVSHFDSLFEVYGSEFKRLPDSTRLRRAQVSVVALDVKTGAILTLIGGRDFQETKFNRAIQSFRQPGSAFKPFVYTAAIDSGFTAASVILDQPITLVTPDGEWRPQNYDRQFYGPVSIRRALAKSINLPAIQVLNEVGARVVVDYAHRMGISSPLQPVPSLAIGACEVIPIEITSAYGVLANGGVRVNPYCIEKIVDRNGRILEEHTHAEEKILSPQTAYIMTSLLIDVVRRGTGASIPGEGFTRPAGGKTGTTNDYTDAWFIGFTPQVVCAVWVGVDERRSMGRGVTGSRGAIPIWVPTMKALHKSLPVARFSRPEGIVSRRVCDRSHKLATKYCSAWGEEVFVEGTEPPECMVDSPSGRRRGDNIMDSFGSKTHRNPSEKPKKRPLMF